MKKVLLFGAVMAAMFYMYTTEHRDDDVINKVSLNEGWKYLRLDDDNTSEAKFHLPQLDDATWEAVRLPHTANVEPLLVNDQWQGICWYRQSLNVPAEYAGKRLYIELEAAMNYSQVWINGTQVTDHHGGYLPVMIDVTDYLNAGASNLVAIRLDNTDNKVTGPKPLKILDFNMYGGLYRNASLIVKDQVHISDPVLAGKVGGGGIFIVTPTVAKAESTVIVKTNVINESKEQQLVTLVQTVYFDGQKVDIMSGTSLISAGDNIDFDAEFAVIDAKLWSPDTPHLYELKSELSIDDEPVETQRTRFGIRSFEFRGTDLYLNGEKTYLRGVNRHQEYPFIGYALSDNAQYRDAKKIKDAGFDYIRLSHYPHAPAFMDACDELGIIVINAILGWQFYADTDAFREYCYRSATELIRRDRNHPCVLLWEMSLNESNMPVPFMEDMNRIVHAEYPGEHVYSGGWKDDVYDIFLQARQHRILHGYHPENGKPLMVSEYGDWEYYSNNEGLNQDKLDKSTRLKTSSRQLRAFGESRLLQQAYNLQESLNDNMQTIAYGDAYWVMYDYNRGHNDDLESSGIMDIFRLPKFSYSFYASQQSPERAVILGIATYWNEASPLDVKVFSNCEKVSLYLNDTLIAEQTHDTDVNSTHIPYPPFTFKLDRFEPGILKAVGWINGETVAEDVVQTPGQATALQLCLDESGKAPEAGVNDVLFLYIAATDENGTVDPNFSATVDLQVEGDVEVMNVGAIQAEAGIATALIRIGDNASSLKFNASTDGLEAGAFAVDLE